MISRRLIRLGAALLAGFGVAWLLRKARNPDPVPPWPEGDAEDPLEAPYGSSANDIRLLTPEELEALRRGEKPPGVRPLPDLTRPGDLGAVNPSLPSTEWPDRMTWHMGDGTWKRIGDDLPPCGQLWILDFDHFERVPTCAGVNYTRGYRATLLRAYAEAHAFCAARDADCPDAYLWMLSAHWGCVIESGLPTVNIYFKFAVVCYPREF